MTVNRVLRWPDDCSDRRHDSRGPAEASTLRPLPALGRSDVARLLPAEEIALGGAEDADFDRDHHRDDQDGPGEDLIRLKEIGCLPKAIADATGGAERFRDQTDAPAEREGEAGAREDVGQDGGQIDLAQD